MGWLGLGPGHEVKPALSYRCGDCYQPPIVPRKTQQVAPSSRSATHTHRIPKINSQFNQNLNYNFRLTKHSQVLGLMSSGSGQSLTPTESSHRRCSRKKKSDSSGLETNPKVQPVFICKGIGWLSVSYGPTAIRRQRFLSSAVQLGRNHSFFWRRMVNSPIRLKWHFQPSASG